MAMSDSRTKIDAKRTVMGLVRSSPLSLGFPAGEQPPLILDGSGSMLPGDEGLMQSMPHAYFKALGLSAAIQTFSGILAGINRPALILPTSKWVSNQGSFLCAWDVSRFMDMEEFTAEMDGYIRKVRSMRPFPGTDRAELPGGLEWQWERENRAKGIPLGDEHRKELEGLAAGAGVECGYEAFEDSRF